MSEADATVRSPETSSFIQILVDSLAQVLAQIAPALFVASPSGGAPSPIVGVAEAPSEVLPASPVDLYILGTCSGRLRGELSLRVPATSVLRLAGIFIGETIEGSPAVEPAPEHREAVVELMRQVAGFVSTAAKAQWGEVQLRLDAAEAAPSWPASSTVWLRVGADPVATALIEMQISAALAACLRTEIVRTETARSEHALDEKPLADITTAVPSAQPASLAQDKADAKLHGTCEGRVDSEQMGKVQLDLLMDVELAVTLRFGSRRLALREILDLNPGSVIELDRRVEEPVEMLLDGRVVARGEVVVMDGNYGLRVTEVAPA
jgi:flagellar motor switch protein FliN